MADAPNKNDLFERIDACGFSCEAGPLEIYQDYIDLKAYKISEYELGHAVDVKLTAEVDGEKFEKWVSGVITSVTRSYGDSGQVNERYTVSAGIPQEWHSPKLIKPGATSSYLRKRDTQ